MGATDASPPRSAGARRPDLVRPAGRLAGLALLGYAGAAALGVGFADRLIFVPPAPSYGADLDGLHRVESSTGDTIAARFVETPGAEVTVLFAHGNAEDLGHGVFHAGRYAGLDVSVVTFDYPGYGLSTGRPSEEGAYAAADAVYRHLVSERGVSPETIVAHGRSLGGAVIVDLASRERVGGVVIESSFVSAYRVMTSVPLVPFDQFSNLAKLPAVEAPVLVIHGERDAVIAPWHGRRLFEAVPEGRRFSLWVERAGHNDLAAVAGDDYWRALEDFRAVVGDALR